jgi:hypothetical protein
MTFHDNSLNFLSASAQPDAAPARLRFDQDLTPRARFGEEAAGGGTDTQKHNGDENGPEKTMPPGGLSTWFRGALVSGSRGRVSALTQNMAQGTWLSTNFAGIARIAGRVFGHLSGRSGSARRLSQQCRHLHLVRTRGIGAVAGDAAVIQQHPQPVVHHRTGNLLQRLRL